MKRRPQVLLVLLAAVGFAIFVTGISLNILSQSNVGIAAAVATEALGSAILFPILVSIVYDRLRERWLGDEVWRLFSELSDAGIVRVYKDRESSANSDNAQTRLSQEFLQHDQGTVRMMGPTLRVFFNPLGPFYRDIETMLKSGNGQVAIRALIEHPESPAVRDRVAIEEPNLAVGDKAQTERDAESSIATMRNICVTIGPHISVRRFVPAPYCTAIIFPHIAFYSPNLLSPEVPVRLPMILFREGSHGYRILTASFEHLWGHPSTAAVDLPQGPRNPLVLSDRTPST
jgi:hypothetical protein